VIAIHESLQSILVGVHRATVRAKHHRPDRRDLAKRTIRQFRGLPIRIHSTNAGPIGIDGPPVHSAVSGKDKTAVVTASIALFSDIPPEKRSHIESQQYMEVNTEHPTPAQLREKDLFQ
jgi:hypothetical protein